MKKLLSLVLAALMLLSFAACSSNNGNGGQTDNTPHEQTGSEQTTEEPISELLPIINPSESNPLPCPASLLRGIIRILRLDRFDIFRFNRHQRQTEPDAGFFPACDVMTGNLVIDGFRVCVVVIRMPAAVCRADPAQVGPGRIAIQP